MATTSKNAYEIRSDLLGLAKQLVEFNYNIQVIKLRIFNVRKDGDRSSTRV
jgi:hypothetical protein